MSWLTKLLFGNDGATTAVALSGVPTQVGIISPWQDSSTLAHIAWSELFAGATDIVDRSAAMSVAPVKRGRAIIVGSVSDLPLVAGRFEGEQFKPIDRQPAWLTSTKTVDTPWHRMANTVDDLIFNGWSLWALQRTEVGTITDAIRVHPSRWSFDVNAGIGIKVDDRPVTDAKSVILFQGPDEGILRTGADIVRGARAMEKSWVGRVQNPIPAMVLHEVESSGGSRITPDEAKAYVDAWSAARTSANGAVGFLPSTLNMEIYGNVATDLYTRGRNNVRLDVANILNLPASLIDGSTASASLTYVTQEGDRTSLIDYLEYWLAPIEARLSMDDVTPHGQVIRFSRSGLTDVPNSPYGASASDGKPLSTTVKVNDSGYKNYTPPRAKKNETDLEEEEKDDD